MKWIFYILFLFLSENGFAQIPKNQATQCNSIIKKFELEINNTSPGIFLRSPYSLVKPDYIALNILNSPCNPELTTVYVSSKYLSPHSLLTQEKITLTGIVSKVNKIPGQIICNWPGTKIIPSYILTPITLDLLSL